VDGIYYIPTKIASEEYTQKAITLDTFQKLDFDYIIASYGGNEIPYSKLTQTYHPHAVFIRHLGDTSRVPNIAHNVMAAVGTPLPPNLNVLRYFPEHHHDYSYSPPVNHKVVKSFVTHFKGMPDYREILIYERALAQNGFVFKMHGIDERDGVVSGALMPQAIKESAWVCHLKYTGCGGFLPREALSCGRPLLVKKRYCLEYCTLEGDLFEDSVNCIDLDLESYQRNILKIQWFSDPDRHKEMCKNTAEKFRKDVNFASDAERLRTWLESARKS
jgi:hypothetical protein